MHTQYMSLLETAFKRENSATKPAFSLPHHIALFSLDLLLGGSGVSLISWTKCDADHHSSSLILTQTCFCTWGTLKPGLLLSSSFMVWVSARWCSRWFQVAQESIDYVHNGSEEFDSLTILANSSELGKQSLPQTLFVTVESVNDEAPVVTANKVLQVSAACFWFHTRTSGQPNW